MPKFLRDIRDELREFPRNPKKYPRLRIKKVESRPQVGVKSLMYRGEVYGETDNYVTSIQFYEVSYSKDKDEDHKTPIKAESSLWFYKTPSVGKNPVRLKCSCEDFRYRWEYSLYQDNALIGNFRKYTRKTPPPPAGYPYANPELLDGYCKHVHSLLLALRDSDLLKS